MSYYLFLFFFSFSYANALFTNENLFQIIDQKTQEIEQIKNHWKEKISYEEDLIFYHTVQRLFFYGVVKPIEEKGSTYTLYDEDHTPRFIIKPFDESIFCLNNRKYFAPYYNNKSFRVRESIPLYRSSQTEALAFEVASFLGFSHLTPKTHLMVLSHNNFCFALQTQSGEKLCCVQEFLPGLQTFQDFRESARKDAEIFACIDFEEFENLYILIWCLYDTDAHTENIYVKKNTNGKFQFIKLDNGLCFPTKNTQFLNTLYLLPQAKSPLSNRVKEILKKIPVQHIIDRIIYYELEDTINAFQKRVSLLQQLIQVEKITFRQIDFYLRFMEYPSTTEKQSFKNFSSEDLPLLDQKPD